VTLAAYKLRVFSRSRIRRVARVVLGALLFAHAAISAAACDLFDRAPAQAFVQHEAMPCDAESGQNANLCLSHCLNADQRADTPQFIVPTWSATTPLAVAVVDLRSDPIATRQQVVLRSAAPPPRILFQTFLE
jgi:hypothetical protein